MTPARGFLTKKYLVFNFYFTSALKKSNYVNTYNVHHVYRLVYIIKIVSLLAIM